MTIHKSKTAGENLPYFYALLGVFHIPIIYRGIFIPLFYCDLWLKYYKNTIYCMKKYAQKNSAIFTNFFQKSYCIFTIYMLQC